MIYISYYTIEHVSNLIRLEISYILLEKMSTTYYNQKWESAISKLLENIEEENYPLEENRN